MKKLTIIILSLVCTNVMAAWTKLESTHDARVTVYADIGKIRNRGMMSKVKMRHLLNFQNKEITSSGRAYQSRKELVEYDCDKEHYRVLASSQHTGIMGSGKVVSFTSYTKQWQPVETNTLEEKLWKVACDKQSITQHD
ncbi:MAG: surface-adhesin E family protein [Methylotenera sp.]